MVLTAPPHVFDDIELENTRLHYVKSGEGEPLVIVPATASLIRQWLPLAQFMGQKFEAYFFELPGHGSSTPYPHQFDSSLVPSTVASFMDKMGHERFNLMGFSFGGLLALRTLEALQDRINKVILLSPCVSKRAIKYSTMRQVGFRYACLALKYSFMQEGIVKMVENERLERVMVHTLSKVADIDRAILEGKDALKVPKSTLDVLAYTLDEIFNLEFNSPTKPFPHQCFFAMSIYDNLLDFGITNEIVQEHFSDLMVRELTLPYHQPPEPPTFDWLNDEFGQFLDLLP